jgi:hypothetical protein
MSSVFINCYSVKK